MELIKIARVFPKKMSMSPDDKDVYFGEPDLFTPYYDEIHISITFTWDIKRGEYLAEQWSEKGKVKIGGVVFDDTGGEFEVGKYVKRGIVMTSRGCPNKCPFCFVPKREGKIRELEIKEGNIIQDNNLLACSNQHIRKVFNMLKSQKKVNFKGGFESTRIKDWIIEELRNLNIAEIWLSYDLPISDKSLIKTVNKLKKYFSRNQIRCYVLIGYYGDTLEKANKRLRRAWEIGTLPFAQRYRTPSLDWNNTYLFKEKGWQKLQRAWNRPAITKSIMKEEKYVRTTL